MERRTNSISTVVVAALLVMAASAGASVERPNKSASVGAFWSTTKEEGDLLRWKTEADDDLSDRTVQEEEEQRHLDGGFSSLEGMLQWSIGQSDPEMLKEAALDIQRLSPEELKQRQIEIKELMEKLKTPSDAELMKIAINDLNNLSLPLEDHHRALQELLILVEPIDNANDLHKLGGLTAVIKELNYPNPEIRSMSAWILGKASQNNPFVQNQILELGTLPKLMEMARSEFTEEASKALYAISALIRNNREGQQLFYVEAGDLMLQSILRNSSIDIRLRRKSVHLLTDLVECQGRISMRLCVNLVEGRGGCGVKNSYVKLQLGKQKSKTRVLKNTENPLWNEEFVFRVHDLEEELVVSVYSCDDDEQHGFFHASPGELAGRVVIPVWTVADEENQSLPPTWFSVERPKNAGSADKDCGKLLLALSLHGKYQDNSTESNNLLHREGKFSSAHDAHPSRKTHDGKHLMKALTGRLEKLFSNKETPRSENSSEISTPSDYEDCTVEPPNDSSFEESIELAQSRNENREMPENLRSGILLDQTYVVSPKELNMVLFAPNSEFQRNLAELQGTTDVQEEPWRWKSEGVSCLRRVVTYNKPATKLVKAIKATEEQTYVKVDCNEFAVLVNVITPGVPYGNTFKIEILYKIMPGVLSSSEEESTHLVVSWAINFTQSTMMKPMIESGARQGLKESFEQFSSLLSQKFRVAKAADTSDKDQILATTETKHQSDSESTIQYFWNFTVVSTVFMLLYVFVHIFLCEPRLQGLEFDGFDLPDSLGELITSGILFLQLERVYNMVSHFVEAKLRRGNDHGVKANGDGWVLTVALIEGANLASMNPTEMPDPYVVFTCNGKTRTSSVKLQTLDPRWNDILEFDAIEEPPSVLDVEVFDFEGPFDQATSLGHAEINFLKHTAAELADIWVPLDGKLAQSSQSRLHLRIFLDNNNGVETIRDYLASLEKEVGKKLSLRSPHKSSNFQKIFGLPPEEFLISDFSCSLKRKMPLQGRLFLSARIVGFYANLFGHKTRFFFLWEDIEDIHTLPPSLATVGSPTLVIILHKGRGLDSKHGAKILDEQGRLHFHFHSFVSFNVASRTIMALWRTRTLDPDQKAEIAAEQLHDDGKPLLLEDTESYLVVEDLKMTKVYTMELPMDPKSLMMMFDGGDLELKVMSKSGCLNYVTTTWDQVTPDVQERRVSYNLSRRISIFGGEVTCTQQKSPLPNDDGWVVNEIMTLHNVPLSDQFRVQFRYQIEKSSFAHNSCKCDIYIGIMWLRNTKFEPRITKNIIGKFTHRLEEILQLVEREVLLTSK